MSELKGIVQRCHGYRWFPATLDGKFPNENDYLLVLLVLLLLLLPGVWIVVAVHPICDFDFGGQS